MPYSHAEAIEDVLRQVEEGKQLGINLPFLLVLLKLNPNGMAVPKRSAANAIRKLATFLPLREWKVGVAFGQILTVSQIARGSNVLDRLGAVGLYTSDWPKIKAQFYQCCRQCASIDESTTRGRVGWLAVHETFIAMRDGTGTTHSTVPQEPASQ